MTGHPRDLLSAYLDGELGVAERAAVELHLEGCPACGEHLRSLRALAAALRGEAVPAVPPDLEARIGRRIDTATVVPFRKRFAVPATIAATIAAVGLVGAVLYQQRQESAIPVAAPHEQRLEAPIQSVEPKDLKKETAVSPLPRPVAKAKVAPAPVPPSAMPENQPAQVPESVAGGTVAGQALERADERRTRDSFERAAAAAPAAMSRAADVPSCTAGIVDAPVEGRWLVRDTDEARPRLAAAALALGGRLLPPDPEAPLTVVVEVPADRYPAFVGRVRAMGVLDLDDVPRVDAPGCVRQRIVLRRVDVN